jgi:hypothetical protein
MNTNTEVSTRKDKNSDEVKTNLTLNWDGVTEDDLRALAQQALIVKLQGGWRKNGIPSEVTVKVIEHKVGTRAPRGPIDLATAIQNLNPEERKALLAKLSQ